LKYEEKIESVIVKDSAQAVLKTGDEIRTIADCRVANSVDIERAMWGTKPGQQVAVKVNRQGQEVTVMLTVEASQGAGSVAVVSSETPAARAAATPVRTANER